MHATVTNKNRGLLSILAKNLFNTRYPFSKRAPFAGKSQLTKFLGIIVVDAFLYKET